MELHQNDLAHDESSMCQSIPWPVEGETPSPYEEIS